MTQQSDLNLEALNQQGGEPGPVDPPSTNAPIAEPPVDVGKIAAERDAYAAQLRASQEAHDQNAKELTEMKAKAFLGREYAKLRADYMNGGMSEEEASTLANERVNTWGGSVTGYFDKDDMAKQAFRLVKEGKIDTDVAERLVTTSPTGDAFRENLRKHMAEQDSGNAEVTELRQQLKELQEWKTAQETSQGHPAQGFGVAGNAASAVIPNAKELRAKLGNKDYEASNAELDMARKLKADGQW